MVYPEYQSYDRIGKSGQRNVEARMKAYDFDSLLSKKDKILDIGCSTGLLSVAIAEKVEVVEAVEPRDDLLRIGIDAAKELGVQNCRFIQSNFQNYAPSMIFDGILCLAVHHHIGLPVSEIAKKLHQMLIANGWVLFESHHLESMDKDWDQKVVAFCNEGFKLERRGTPPADILDDGVEAISREFILFRRK